MDDENLINMMKKSLPDYAVNCLINAGYDNVNSIALMKANEEPGNSLDQIESFIFTHISDDTSCRSQRGLLVQENIYISPGHRSVINDFINKIKRELNLKRSLNSTNHSDPKRKEQKDQHTETSSKPLHDLNEMSDNV